VPEDRDANYHIFFFRTRTPEERDRVLTVLKENGIQATFHYVPLHSSPYGREELGCEQELPVTQRCSETLIRLPVYPQLADRVEEVAGHAREVVSSNLSVAKSDL